MNKKFSTLLAGVALLGAMSANAGNPVTSLQKTGNGLYQLKAADGVLAMTPEGALKLEATTESANLASTLWCVEVTEEGYGKAPIFDFTNKATGQRLDIQYAGTLLEGLAEKTPSYTDVETANDSTRVGGEISGWAYLNQYTSIPAAEQAGKTLYSYFKADSVIGLVANGTNIQVKKLGAADAYKDAATGTELTKFILQEADMIRLQAPEINTILGLQAADKGVALTFTPDEQGEKVAVANPFNGKNAGKFLAEAIDSDNDYVFVLTADSSYLRVDTAIVNESGERFRAFKWSDLSYAKRQASTAATKPTSAADSISKVTGLSDQYKFAFSYYPSKDSLVIQVKSAMDYDPNATNGSDWVKDAAETVLPTAAGTKGENNFVTVQDLIKDKVRIVTIYDKKETDISLGYKGCEAVYNGRTSVEDGLYFIMNQKGQYLASPIHVNGGEATWVTVKADEQLTAHMPAYQWVVLKKNTADKVKAYSPVTITNREFATELSATAQLMLNEGAKYMYTSAATDINIEATDSLIFVQVKDAEGVKGNAALIAEAYQDSLLGYKNIPDAKFLLDEYTFKYLHPYATGENSKYLAKGAGKDSLLNVLNGKDAFRLIEDEIADYGYTVTADVAKRVGIKQLRRTEYAISLKDAYMDEAKENKYAMSAYAEPIDYFFLKENNHYEGECYYAIVKANNNAISDVKAGVTDDILDATVKVQPLEETRTSAFAINPDKTPLYRRFNNANLGEADGRDTLRFYENVRHEYLMDENNKEGGLTDEFVNYVGMWTADKATGLAFQIDTTWVVRGRGYIKPQYLISVAHNDFAGIEGTPCTEDGPHITPDGQITDDPMACKHAHPAIPGFERAKYMVSFQDSVAVYGQDKPYADVAGGYTRVGFVEGIRVADTLWILPAQYRSVANDKVNFATLQAYNDSVVAKGLPAIKNLLTEDVHKNYVWSFRYVHPEKANNVTEEGLENSFLFESNIWPNSATTVNESIAPTEKAAWLKIQNGCVVLTDDKSTFANAKTGGDGALVFNVENKENDQLATDNETITTSEVTVIAGNGNVQVVGAEGKKVVITNILGQTVANTVITSDNATIAAPQGVVVVAVEGEEAVKAIVK